ncbi:MAG: hypothetical protein R6U63_07285 [Longimicrobiales bacterium]
MRGTIRAAAVLLAMSVSACAGNEDRADWVAQDRYRISETEIAEHAAQVRNLYQLVERLRPHWLDADVAFQGQMQLGSIEALGSLGPDYARSLVYLDGTEAGARLPGLTGIRITGAIVIHR